MALFICALCKVQTVCFERLAAGFDHSARKASSLRRIQRFMADYMLETNLIAKLVFSLLPHKPPYTLTMDRTNWKFGSKDINALVLAVCYRGVAFPILFSLMPKRGNSNTAERMDIINRYIELFGRETIHFLVADREFVGEDWMKTSGFNTEDTHLTDLERLEKLFALVINAFTWAYLTGIFLHENVKPIRLLNNGRKTKSLFKYGLNHIEEVLLNACFHDDINICSFLSCT